MESEDPYERDMFDNQILNPKSSPKYLQLQSQVRDVFNAWINGVSAGKLVSTYFNHLQIPA